MTTPPSGTTDTARPQLTFAPLRTPQPPPHTPPPTGQPPPSPGAAQKKSLKDLKSITLAHISTKELHKRAETTRACKKAGFINLCDLDPDTDVRVIQPKHASNHGCLS